MSDLINIAIMTIFAREMLEGTIIVGQYRTVVKNSIEWQEPERQKEGLKAVNMAALLACIVAIITITIVAIPLALLSRNLEYNYIAFIEGASKIVAAICVLQLSLKIPKFLGVYPGKKDENGLTVGLSLKSIRFNVAWNIWREVAECGAFLLPFFLTGEGVKAVPLSGLIGIAVGGFAGLVIYYANKMWKSKVALAAFMATLLLFLSVGLFVGACHEFEEIYGMTDKVYNIGYTYVEQAHDASSESDDVVKVKVQTFWSDKKLPFALLKPFGYSSGRTQLQIACFWSWLSLGVALHIWKYVSSKKLRQAQELAEEEKAHPSMVKSLEHHDTTAMDHDIETASGPSNDEASGPLDNQEASDNEEIAA